MEQEDFFNHDTFNNMMPYLDYASRARLPETSRHAVGNNTVCSPTATVFRAHRVNGTCPPFAQTFNANTNCCETSLQNAHQNANQTPDQVSDMEFLRAVKHGYQFPPTTSMPNPHRTVKRNLKKVVPDLAAWFHRGRNAVPGAPPPPFGILNPAPPPLVLDASRPWFDLVMKFYILLRPAFTIRATTAGVVNTLFFNFQVILNVGPYRDRLIASIQEVGAINVFEGVLPFQDPSYVPYPLKCRTLIVDAPYVDISNLANVIADPRCGFLGEQSMQFGALAIVGPGIEWVQTLVDIFLSMWQSHLENLYVRVSHTANPPPPVAGVPVGATIIPQAPTTVEAVARYRPVALQLLAALPAGYHLSQHILDDIPATWGVLWEVNSNSHVFELRVTRRGKVSMKFRTV